MNLSQSPAREKPPGEAKKGGEKNFRGGGFNETARLNVEMDEDVVPFEDALKK